MLPFYIWEYVTGPSIVINSITIGSILYVGIFASLIAFIMWNKSILIIGVPGIRIQKKGKVEVYLLDYNKRIYGRQLTIEVVKKIRPIKKYKNIPALLTRIKKDISVVRSYFK